jgi:transcriptional regulator with XRE-family HTH domain
MLKSLGIYIKQRRIELGLNTAELALKIGYTNPAKGMNRIIKLERDGIVHPDLLKKLIDVFKLDEDIVNKLISKDREAYEAEFERWVNEPVKMKYTVRLMPAVYLSYDLPSDIKTEDEAINYATVIAKEKSNLAWLELDRRTTIFINELGEMIGKCDKRPYQSDPPTRLKIL